MSHVHRIRTASDHGRDPVLSPDRRRRPRGGYGPTVGSGQKEGSTGGIEAEAEIKRRDDSTVDDDGRADDDDFLFCIDRVGDRDVVATLELGLDVLEGDGDDTMQMTDAEIIDLSNDDDVSAAVVVDTIAAIAGGDYEGEKSALDAVCTKPECLDLIENKERSSTKQIPESTLGKDAPTVATSATSTFSTEEFRFVVDKEGLKELGGDDDDGFQVAAVENQSMLGASKMNDETPSAFPPEDLGKVKGGEPITTPYKSDANNDRKNSKRTIFNVNDDCSDGDGVAVQNYDSNNDDDDDDSADKLSSHYQRNDRLDATAGGNVFLMDVKERVSASSSLVLLDHGIRGTFVVLLSKGQAVIILPTQ